MSSRRFLSIAIVITALGASACGSDGSSSTKVAGTSVEVSQQTIDAEGGSMHVGGAVITFPKGAVATATKVTITVEDGSKVPAGYVALSRLFTCKPSGTDFAVPVEMKMPFVDDGQGGTLFWSTGEDPTFKDLGGRVEGTTMIATVQHFSAGFVGRKK